MPNPNLEKPYLKCPIHDIIMDEILAIDPLNPDIIVYRCPHNDHNEEFESEE